MPGLICASDKHVMIDVTPFDLEVPMSTWHPMLFLTALTILARHMRREGMMGSQSR